MLPDVTPLPPMRAWTSTRQNILVDDELQLQNIPYLGDDPDEAFIDKLLAKTYRGVDTDGMSECLDDDIFLELVDRLVEIQDVDSGEESLDGAASQAALDASNANRTQYPCPELFAAISSRFPSDGTAKELRKRYDKYVIV